MMRALAALLDPGPLVSAVQRTEAPNVVAGLAMMLEGRLSFYRAVAPRAGWPELGKPVSRRAAPEVRLLGAIGLHVTGSESAESEYRPLLRSNDLDVATLALLLLAFLYSDAGKTNAAIKLLERDLPKLGRSPVRKGLASLQLGLRLAENGSFGEAILRTEDAKRFADATKPTAWGRVLSTIAEHNLFAYEWQVDQSQLPSPQGLPSKSDQPALLRDSLLIEEGTAKFLETIFDQSLADPSTRSVQFRSVDPVEVPLYGAVLRSELLADWNDVRRARMLLGRYLTVSRLGTPNGVPAAAFELLRRAGDAAGAQSAARTASRIGPLGPLRLFASSLVTKAPFTDEPGASLAAIIECAHLLAPAEAGVAATKLMESETIFFRQWASSSRALAELVRVAPAEIQTEAAVFTRQALETSTSSAMLQELPRVVRAIRWPEVEESERASWIRFIRSRYGTEMDTHPAASHGLIALSDIDRAGAEEILREGLADSPSLDAISVLLSIFDPLPAWARRDAWPTIASGLRTIRESAAKGSHGFGGVDVARLAVAVLNHRARDTEGWTELTDFLLDPQVDASSKAGALDDLGRATTYIPRAVEMRLREAVDWISAADLPLGVSLEEFEATKLRLALRIGGLAPEEILARILRLAGSPNISGRMVAAQTIASGSKRLGHDVALTVALTLSHDIQPDVRGAAGASLAQLVGGAGASLDQARHRRVRELLAQPGVVEPLGVLRGLYLARQLGRPIDRVVEREVRSIARHHLSFWVRDGARRVLALSLQAR